MMGESMSAWDPWAVKDDAERDHWEFMPLQRVGPLVFGMSKEEAATALGGRLDDLRGWHRMGYRLEEAGTQLYFDSGEQLAAVCSDMRTGPQIILDSVELVAQVPSAMERWLENYLTTRGLPLYYGANYVPGSVDLGFFLLGQRAGDHILTRPLMLNEEFANDTQQIPDIEWSIAS
jgi:hypothetical protein